MRKSKILGLLTAATLLAGSVSPIASADETKPAEISVGNASAIEDEINDLIKENEDATPSVSVIVFDDKQDICSVIYGYADIENGVPADENTVYEWGSISKLLVWTSAMQLYEQGKLDLNEDIRAYLPEGFLDFLTYDEPITMLDLMNHSAGFLSPYKEFETETEADIMPLDKILATIAPAQGYPPGEAVAYSNYGASLAGYVVQCVSGLDFADYVNENIFKRLGMEHTAIRPDLSDNQWVARQRKEVHCYAGGVDGLQPLGECRRYIHIYPAGAACGTISDLAVFARAFLADSKDCPLFDNDSTLDEMLTPTLYFADGTAPRFCHGFMADSAGVRLLGHGGNTEGFSSLLQLDAEGGTGFVMMTNKQLDRTYKGFLPETLYGKQDISAIAENDFARLELSGHYKMTGGTFGSGCFKVYSLFSDDFRISGGDGGYTGTNGVTSVRQISDSAALIKLITGREYFYYIRSENGEVKALENGSIDFIKVSDAGYYSSWAVLILMLAGIVFMALFAVIHAVRLGKYKGKPEYKFKLTELFTNVSAAAIAVCAALLAMFGIDSMVLRAAVCIAITLFTAAMAAGIVLCIKQKPRRAFTAATVVQSICGVFVIIGVVYWELYRFWGF